MISTIRQSKIRYLLIGLFWLFAWQVLYKIIDQPLFLASPLDTVKALWMRLAQVETWKYLEILPEELSLDILQQLY